MAIFKFHNLLFYLKMFNRLISSHCVLSVLLVLLLNFQSQIVFFFIFVLINRFFIVLFQGNYRASHKYTQYTAHQSHVKDIKHVHVLTVISVFCWVMLWQRGWKPRQSVAVSRSRICVYDLMEAVRNGLRGCLRSCAMVCAPHVRALLCCSVDLGRFWRNACSQTELLGVAWLQSHAIKMTLKQVKKGLTRISLAFQFGKVSTAFFWVVFVAVLPWDDFVARCSNFQSHPVQHTVPEGRSWLWLSQFAQASFHVTAFLFKSDFCPQA